MTAPRLHARPGLSLEQAVDAVQKYKGFLFLYGTNPGKTLSPSRYVDYVWHTHIIEHIGAPTTDPLNVSEQPASYAASEKTHRASISDRAKRVDYAIELVKLPPWITLCKPVVDWGIKLEVRPAELLEKMKVLSEQRLHPAGYTSSMVNLDAHASG